VNVVYKIPPYIPESDVYDSQTSLTDADIDQLVDWGFNLVRLGVMWEAVETVRGVYNQTYLAEVDKLITKLGDKGIYTLVDAHQDVLARQICGEGMPNFYARDVLEQMENYCVSPWTDYILGPAMRLAGFCRSMKDYGFKYDDAGLPLIESCQENSFFMYYTSPESFTLFRSLYNNDMGMQDKYVDYWAAVTDSLSQNPFVVGFDPFNEPMPSWEDAIDLFNTIVPGHFD
jgi:endoglycosylceramidase